MSKKIVIIGGGAAGFFAAQLHKTWFPAHQVLILEQSAQVLKKVKISGGGRCNVTHACFDVNKLVQFYPRGGDFLKEPFQTFQPKDMVKWLAQKGVPTKTEADGRMFPRSNQSQTIVDCLYKGAIEAGVELHLQMPVQGLVQKDKKWEILLKNGKNITADKVLISAGSSPAVWKWLAPLGVEIVPPVPSLFTFEIQDARLEGLAGIALEKARAEIPQTDLAEEGALLITHWGLSAPAILRLSAWGARQLAEKNYQFELKVNWSGESPDKVLTELKEKRDLWNKKAVAANPLYGLPARLWKSLMAFLEIDEKLKWAQISKKDLAALHQELTSATFQVKGKSTFKDEFVTAGGVALHQISNRTLAHKTLPSLYFAGEVLDIDAITGGFNFQAAWTTAFLAARAMGESC